MAESEEYDDSWLEQFLTHSEEEKAKPTDQRRLEELGRMQKSAESGALSGRASNLKNIDRSKYLMLCELFEREANFTCSAPDGWEEEYVRHMQEKLAKYGAGDSHSRIKANGRKRLF